MILQGLYYTITPCRYGNKREPLLQHRRALLHHLWPCTEELLLLVGGGVLHLTAERHDPSISSRELSRGTLSI